jgi:hypothetical protein
MPDDEIESNDFSAFSEVGILPENSLPVFGILIVSYMDQEDELIYDEYFVVGKMTLRDLLGTLESVKFRISMQQFGVVRHEDGDDD